MQYNYDFELAALLLMIIIFLHFVSIRQFPEEKNKVFGRLLGVCIAETAFNIASSIGLANTDFIPQIVNEFLAFAFFVLEGLCSWLMFQYVLLLCAFEKEKTKKISIFGSIPFVIFGLFVLANPWIGFYFYMEDGRYHQGFGADFGYLYIIFYYVLNIALIFIRKRIVDRYIKIVIISCAILAVAQILIQFYARGMLLTSAGNLFFVFMVYLAMQNPSGFLDPVTGVGNESAFTIFMTEMLKHDDHHMVVTVAVRQFQQINKLFGVENCNHLLEEIAGYFYKLCGKHCVFHMSGDSFTLLLTEDEAGRKILQQVQERFQKEWQIKQNPILLESLIIVQHFPEDFSTLPEYRGQWQFMMDRAKQNRGQQKFETDPKLLAEYERQTALEEVLQNAVKEKAFQVYYQPIYSLKDKRIVSLEALVRMQDPKLGFVSPDEFIPLAEKNGSIFQIGAIVLEECCRFLSKHVLPNPSLGIKTIQMNVSPAQCMQQNMCDSILPVLEQYHIPPSMITLEVTESAAVHAPELMQHHMEALGATGIRFAADDYGSGNSNFSNLIRFPFREVKIDKKVTWAYFENDVAKVILENEIKIMEQLGIPVVAEGVEEKEQSDVLEQLGVEYIQGYYYGKPMPEKECLRYIRNFISEPEEYGK